MARLLEANILAPNYVAFYAYLKFAGVDLKALLRDLIEAVKNKPNTSAKSDALNELHEAYGWTSSHLVEDFNDVYRDNPSLHEPIRSCALKQCLKQAQVTPVDEKDYICVRKNIAEVFNLSCDAQEFLEFAYICYDENNVSDYFERVLEIFETYNKKG